MKIKDTTYTFAEAGTINVLSQANEELGNVPTSLAKAGDVNFTLNKLDSNQNSIHNEIANVLLEAGITPNGLTDDQLITAINSIIVSKINLSGDNATFSALADTAKENLVKLFSPDYTAGITITTNYTTLTQGWFIVVNAGNSTGTLAVYVDSILVYQFGVTAFQDKATSIFVDKGSVITWTIGNGNIQTYTFYPCKTTY